ncbi:Protein TANC1 [Durusdinium trenchii]|uniref:Protein TANC1 n=1 Tax=Durusdinium trenchii TaxID=1381693 RepID=A0ABP0HSD0_9DINO
MSLGRCFLGISRLLFGPRPSTLVLLRHGEREDYMAEKAGRGVAWISASARPWDPPLAPNGRQQAQSAATRLRQVLTAAQLPPPSRIFTSPLVRAVETADWVAEEFGVDSLFVEEGLTESAYEQWMRQVLFPDAIEEEYVDLPEKGYQAMGGSGCQLRLGRAALLRHAKGTPHAVQSRAERSVQGTPVRHEELRPEALEGLQALLLTAAELKEAGWRRVDENYASYVPVRGKGYRWGHFEFQEEVIQRCCAAVLRLLERHPQETLVFVSHGGPTQYCFKELSGQKYRGGSRTPRRGQGRECCTSDSGPLFMGVRVEASMFFSSFTIFTCQPYEHAIDQHTIPKGWCQGLTCAYGEKTVGMLHLRSSRP